MFCATTRGGVVINEIMYQPAGIPENVAGEFIELHNTDAFAVDLSNWQFTKGVNFVFPAGTSIPADGYLVVVPNVTAFQTAHPGIANVVGNWTGSLSNRSEEIQLENATAAVQDSVTYADSGDWALRVRETLYGGWAWSSAANGGGRSLELQNPTLDNGNGQNWGDSAVAGGTPSAVNSIASADIAPLIRKVKHSPAVPRSTDAVEISCEIDDEVSQSNLVVTLFWREGSGQWQTAAMTRNGSSVFAATLPPKSNLVIVEFYVQASDGAKTRTWPAPTSEGQNANCQYQVANEPPTAVDSYYRLILTSAENTAFNNLASSNPGSDRQFNVTLVATRGSETTIRYRSSMRIRGNSSRNYQFKPMRVSLPSDAPWDGVTTFNLNPRSPYLQFLGTRLLQAAGLRAEDSIPAEVRRNGVEYTTSGGDTPDYGKWVRVEETGGDMVDNHWPAASGGNLYRKGRPDQYWRSTGWVVPSNPDGTLDGWSKQNNAAANDWSDLTSFFTTAQNVTRPHFPGTSTGNSAGSTGVALTGNGNWNNTALTSAEITTLETVADLDQWARWFAAMTIIQDLETNISNGEDDDYTVYFAPSAGGQRRMHLVAHDLDTILGLGDSPASYNGRGLYDMCETGSVFRPLLPLFGTSLVAGNAAFRTKYLTALRELYGTVFNAVGPNPPFHAFVDSHLTGWVPTSTITSIKNFATSRQNYLLGLAGGAAITPPAATAAATFTSAHGSLMISEVLANNAGAVNVGGAYPDIVELYNAGTTPADLSGRTISDDAAAPLKYSFPAGTTIAAGDYLLLYADDSAAPGHLPFSLAAGGEGVFLYEALAGGGGLIDSIVFGAQPADYSIGRTGAGLTTWALCTPTFGAANAAVASLAAPGGVRINEWLGDPDYQLDDDFLELYNPATQPVALGGMSVTDDFINYPAQRTLPQLSFMGPASFLRMNARGDDAAPGDATELPFGIDGTFGWLALVGQNGTIVDRVDIVAQAPDSSTGRTPDGAAATTRFGLTTSLATPGASNATPPANILALMNSLRVTELLFRPDNFEFIELQNIGAVTLDLSGVRFTRGIAYTFEAGATLAPGAFVVICKNRMVFEGQFGTAVPLAAGQFTGSLSNSGENVAFQLPTPWEENILNFEYDAAWYPPTNSGYSLSVVDPFVTTAGDWDEKRTWASTVLYGTPGRGDPPTITSALSAASVIGDPFSYQIVATKIPTSYDATPLPAGLNVNAATGLINGTPAVVGTFDVTITATNSTGSDTKTLTITVAPSGPLAAFAWSAIPSPQQAGVPFPVTLRAVDSQGRTVPGFVGPANLSGPNLSPIIGTGTSGWGYPLYTFYHDARTQTIYLANELGGAARITALALNVSGLPGQTMNNWTIRMKHTALSSYATNAWEGPASGWTTVFQQNQTISTTGWVTFLFSTPFDYDGVSNLIMDFSFNNSSYTSAGASLFTATGGNRTLYSATDSGYGDPLNWSGTTSPTPNAITRIPNIKLTTNAVQVTVTPGVTGDFAGGVWSGNVSATPAAGNASIHADDGAGHAGNSNSFNLLTPMPPVISSPASAIAVVGRAFSYEIIATNFATSYAASDLPGDLVVDSASGLISGTPTAAGSAVVNLSATSAGGTGNAVLALEVQSDADGDGMGDAWESAHGLNPASAADAALDFDADGQSNLAEWLAGTAPDDGSSRLAVLSETFTGSDVQITWRSVAGKRYRVAHRDLLTAGTWLDLTPTPIVATGDTTSWTHAGGMSGGAMRYYRIEVVP